MHAHVRLAPPELRSVAGGHRIQLMIINQTLNNDWPERELNVRHSYQGEWLAVILSPLYLHF